MLRSERVIAGGWGGIGTNNSVFHPLQDAGMTSLDTLADRSRTGMSINFIDFCRELWTVF